MHQVTLTLHPDQASPIIHPDIYGQFAEHLGHCIYEGLWVGEDSEIPNRNGLRIDVVDALKALSIPVLRWPGGCFADEYHWKDGVGPREKRKRIYNSHWGGVVENNHFGTHEFFELCEQLGCRTYICGNVGSGTVQEMSEWVEYMTSPSESPMADWRRENGRAEPWKVDYFGVGNESWGCGGHMRPEYYADEYRRYNTFVRTYGPNPIKRFACGANTTDYHWTEVLMDRARHHMDGLSLHNYTLLDAKWPPSGSATEFGEQEWFSILRAAAAMDPLLQRHGEIMDRHDPEAKVGLIVDEWGTWYPVEPGTNPGFLYQQNTLRDALVASVHFDIFHKHARRVTMTNIAQMVNVLQAMVLTKGAEMVLTPTYWAFEMYKPFQGAQQIEIRSNAQEVHGLPVISSSAAQTNEGLVLAVSCLDPNEGSEVRIPIENDFKVSSGRILSAETMQSHNNFEASNVVEPVPFTDWVLEGDELHLTLPAKSLVVLRLVG
jgi:alpha-L-arabinofuranosidase